MHLFSIFLWIWPIQKTSYIYNKHVVPPKKHYFQSILKYTEANVPELLENLEEMFPRYTQVSGSNDSIVLFIVMQIVQIHNVGKKQKSEIMFVRSKLVLLINNIQTN